LIKCPENPSKTLIFSISFFAAVKSFGIISWKLQLRQAFLQSTTISSWKDEVPQSVLLDSLTFIAASTILLIIILNPFYGHWVLLLCWLMLTAADRELTRAQRIFLCWEAESTRADKWATLLSMGGTRRRQIGIKSKSDKGMYLALWRMGKLELYLSMRASTLLSKAKTEIFHKLWK
jgi:hypothetical protein